ncbi:MAG: insulinase family protein, partial [Patescibacteria group bacterium]
MINFEKNVLGNGLRIIIAPMNSTEAVTLLVLVGVGSRYETKEINGISHLLEHMFFKGTKSRPESGQINKYLD